MRKMLIAALAGAAAIPAVAQTQAPAVPAPQAQAAPHARHLERGNAVRTRAEAAAHVQKMFARLDANRDGFVTKDEGAALRNRMGAAGERRIGTPPNHIDRSAMFDRIDANRDGSISREEFSKAPTMRQRVAVRGDGPRPGARTMRMRRGGAMGLDGRMFELADVNRDNRVSLQEATDAALRRFDTADLNRDGQLTPDERRQTRERMRAQRTRG